MTLPLLSPLQSQWTHQCLEETSWSSWKPVHLLGEGGWSMAVLVRHQRKNAVLLMDRPNKPPPSPNFPSSMESYESNMRIRQACLELGMRVPNTLESPRPWSGGAAVLMTRIQGQDHGRAMKALPLDAFKIGSSVARLVEKSQGLGHSHPAHAHGFGRHLFGKQAEYASAAEAYAGWVAPLKGNDPFVDDLVDRLQQKADLMLKSCPRTTQVWDVGDRNVMIGPSGRVVGLVDQADMYSGDPMFVPGFSMAMLGDLHGWEQIQDYEAGWKKAWKITDEQWLRVRLHRLASHGRLTGKQWRRNGEAPAEFKGWVECAQALLDQL